MRVLVARDEAGEVLGIAPLMIDQRRVCIIGQRGHTRAENLDFFVRRAHEGPVTRNLCDFLTRELDDEWDAIRFDRVPKDSPNLEAMLEAFSRQPLVVRLTREEVAPYLELPASWESFLGSRPKKFRNQWHNSCRRLAARGEARLLEAGKDVAFDDAFEHLRRLNRERWGEQGASFRSDRYLRFHTSFGQRMLDQGGLCLLLLAVDGRPVAASYDFVYGGKMWGIQGGWDRGYAHERVGAIVTGKVIAWGIDHGQREYDFLGGDYPHKRRWATSERVTVYLEAVKRS